LAIIVGTDFKILKNMILFFLQGFPLWWITVVLVGSI
jgi:hypothetical protein